MHAMEAYPLLSAIESPADLRRLPPSRLEPVARELRRYLIEAVSQKGGHFAAGLGTVELSVALHYIYQTPHDRVVWDVGHQAYPHKVLTGRRDRLVDDQAEGRTGAVPRAPRESLRCLRRRPFQHLAERGARHGDRRRAHRHAAAHRRRHRRRRDERRHGLRGAESHRLARSRHAGGAQRQRHVDLGGDRCLLQLSGASAVGQELCGPARAGQAAAAASAARAGAGARLTGVHARHRAARDDLRRHGTAATSGQSTATISMRWCRRCAICATARDRTCCTS